VNLRRYEAVLKAAADPTRARILKMLEGGELCVCQLIAVLELSPSTVSKHLSLLRSAGLVRDRKEGKWVLYELDRETDPTLAGATLDLLAGALGDDSTVLLDRQRLTLARRGLGPSSCTTVPTSAENRR